MQVFFLAADYGPEFVGSLVGACVGTLGAWSVMVFQKNLELKHRRDEIEREQRLSLLYTSRLIRHRLRMVRTVWETIAPFGSDELKCLNTPTSTSISSVPPIDLNRIIFLAESDDHKLLSDISIADALYSDLCGFIDEYRGARERFAATPAHVAKYKTVGSVLDALDSQQPEDSDLQLLSFVVNLMFQNVAESERVLGDVGQKLQDLSNTWKNPF